MFAFNYPNSSPQSLFVCVVNSIMQKSLEKEYSGSSKTLSEPRSLFERLQEASDQDQQWLPQIFVKDNDGKRVDLLEFLEPTQEQMSLFICLGYPKSASFQFQGFHGTEDLSNIIKAIVDAAFSAGSMIRASKRKQVTKLRVASVDFFCVKAKQNSTGSKQKFNEQCIQATNTIIQREHQIASVKSKSRHSVLKTVAPTDEEQGTKIRTRRSTGIRPLSKDQCCNFGFTIFCSAKDSKWYLAFSKK